MPFQNCRKSLGEIEELPACKLCIEEEEKREVLECNEEGPVACTGER